MSHLLIWIFYWLCLAVFVATIYILTVRGKLYCVAILIGHWWAVLKEEVARPIRVIREALHRDIKLDEHEENISG